MSPRVAPETPSVTARSRGPLPGPPSCRFDYCAEAALRYCVAIFHVPKEPVVEPDVRRTTSRSSNARRDPTKPPNHFVHSVWGPSWGEPWDYRDSGDALDRCGDGVVGGRRLRTRSPADS